MEVGREGQGHRDIRPLEQPLAVGQEAIDQAPEARRGGIESGADGIGSDLLQFDGDNGGEQGMQQILTFRLAEISVLLMGLNHASHAYSEPARRQSRL